MKPKATKGQAALEYMVTYGWMILVVGLVAVVLWQYGVFNQQSTPPGCTGFSQLTPQDPKVSFSDGNAISFILQNDAGTKVTITSVNVSLSGSAGTCTYLTPQDLRPGQSSVFSVPNNCVMVLPGVGAYYKEDITIGYTNIASGITHASVGECHGQEEQ